MKNKRFVLDANVWISYFIKGNAPRIAKIIINNRIKIYSCDELITELKRVLNYPHLGHYEIDTNAAVRFIKQITTEYSLQYPIKHYIPGDADDNYLIALALQTGSGYITTGDKHILDEKERLEKKYRSLNIITLAAFEKMMK